MGGGRETGAEVEGVAGGAVVVVAVDATEEAGGVGAEIGERSFGMVDAGGTDRGEEFDDEVAGDVVGVAGTSFDSELSVSIFPASPISSLNPNFNSSGTFSPT